VGIEPDRPLRDDDRVGWYERHVVPRLVELTCVNRRMLPLRQRALEDAAGTVVELGFGSGGNLAAYPATVRRVLAVDPSTVGRKLARRRLEDSSIDVEFVGLNGSSLSLDDQTVDNAVSTWTLCTIPDAAVAISEVGRVLKPGGRFFFLEHGLAPDPKVARAQRRFDGVQQRVAGGCHLTRDIRKIVEDGGLAIERCENFFITGPKPWSYMYAGTATRIG
jgi:ubiquinone/menaquinone biosynthesis C-methylase UbiE